MLALVTPVRLAICEKTKLKIKIILNIKKRDLSHHRKRYYFKHTLTAALPERILLSIFDDICALYEHTNYTKKTANFFLFSY